MSLKKHKKLKMARRNRKKLAKIQRLNSFESIHSVKHHRTAIYNHLINNDDIQNILEQLEKGFEKELFLASLNNLNDKGNPLRFNNFSYCMREIISLILERYSSDKDILNCSWYKNKTDNENGVTRAQRAKYAIQGGLSDEKVFEILEIDKDEVDFIEETLRQFTKKFNVLSKHTHVREKVFNIGDTLCEELSFEVFQVMRQILMLIKDLRSQITSHIEGVIDKTLIDEFISKTFDDLDILSTHSVVDYSELDSYFVSKIFSQYVEIKGSGMAHCELQWGSGSDMRNGIGASMSQSFPYNFTIHAKITNLEELELGGSGVELDTSVWYE